MHSSSSMIDKYYRGWELGALAVLILAGKINDGIRLSDVRSRIESSNMDEIMGCGYDAGFMEFIKEI